MQKRTRNIASGAFLLLFSVAVFAIAWQIQPRIPVGVDSGFFPEVVSAVLAVMALIILVNGLRMPAGEDDRALEPQGRNAVIATLVLITIFGIAMAHLGFIVAAAGYLTAQFYILAPREQRNIFLFAGIGVGAAFIIHLIFTGGFGVILPTWRLG